MQEEAPPIRRTGGAFAMNTKKTAGASKPDPNFARGKTPREAEAEMKSIPRQRVVQKQVLDDPSDPSTTPVEPRCRKCGATFTSEDELLEHAKTCKGGHDPMKRPHQR